MCIQFKDAQRGWVKVNRRTAKQMAVRQLDDMQVSRCDAQRALVGLQAFFRGVNVKRLVPKAKLAEVERRHIERLLDFELAELKAF